jgi:hypothetical protein
VGDAPGVPRCRVRHWQRAAPPTGPARAETENSFSDLVRRAARKKPLKDLRTSLASTSTFAHWLRRFQRYEDGTQLLHIDDRNRLRKNSLLREASDLRRVVAGTTQDRQALGSGRSGRNNSSHVFTPRRRCELFRFEAGAGSSYLAPGLAGERGRDRPPGSYTASGFD